METGKKRLSIIICPLEYYDMLSEEIRVNIGSFGLQPEIVQVDFMLS